MKYFLFECIFVSSFFTVLFLMCKFIDSESNVPLTIIPLVRVGSNKWSYRFVDEKEVEIFWVGADTTWRYFTFGYSRSAGQTGLLQLQWSPLLQLQFTLMLFCLYISRTTDGRWHNTGKQLKIWQLRITWKSDFVRKKNLNLERFFPKNEAVGLNCCKFMVASY